MALSGIEIFKMLPKTNCGDCSIPTCLAFAMKIAAGQAEIASCPHVGEDVVAQLAESGAPPMRGVTVGVGENAFTVGEETVLFRHDKTFVNPSVFAVRVESGAPDDELDAVADSVKAASFERVQQMLRAGCIALVSTAGAARFAEAARRLSSATGLPLVLMTEDPGEMRAALEAVGETRPLIHAATQSNADAMIALAKEHGCPLAVRGHGPEAVAALTEKASAEGLKDLVLDFAPESAGEALKYQVYARRAALQQKFTPLGYPVITFPGEPAGGDGMLETVFGAVDVLKYGSIIVLAGAEPWRLLPLLVLRQNIYTDPQRPMQVEQGVYEIGSPGPDAPFLVTTNFSLTYFIVSSEIESSRVPARLGIVDAEGLSVLTGWAAGKFVPDRIASFMKSSGISDRMKKREVIIPGMVAQISGELAEELDGWDVVVGPREATDLVPFLKRRAG